MLDESADLHIEGEWNGLPYNGPPLDIKADDPEEMQPQLHLTAHVQQFLTSDPEQLEAFIEVCQTIASMKGIFSSEEKRFSSKHGGWFILLRWFEKSYIAPARQSFGTVVGRR